MKPILKQPASDAPKPSARRDAEHVYEQAKDLCPLFYRNGGGFYSCGWECSDGWYDALSDMSAEMEALNERLYSSAKVFIHADQIKEKFGTLRCYFGVCFEQPFFVKAAKAVVCFLPWLVGKLVDFKMSQPNEIEREYRSVQMIDKEQYGKMAEHANIHTLGTAFESGGFYFRSTNVICARSFKLVPTRFRFLHKAMESMKAFSAKIYVHPGKKACLMMQYAEISAQEIADKYEKKCFGLCEECGRQIGTEYEPRCETKGWIRYICEKCAKAHQWKYMKLEKKDKQP